MYRSAMSFVVVLFLTMGGALRAATDLSPYFQSLKDVVAGFPFSTEEKDAFLELINFAEQQASDEYTSFAATGQLMDAILAQLTEVAFQGQETGGAVALSQPAQDDEEGPFDTFLNAVDSIKGTLFLEAGPLSASVTVSPVPPQGSCSVAILMRTVGTVLSDPGGTVGVNFAHTTDLEARGNPSGGSYSWEFEPFNDKLYLTSGNRFSFRAQDRATYRITVTYTGPQEEQCQDILWVRTQGAFPDD